MQSFRIRKEQVAMLKTKYMNTFVWVGLATSEQEAAKDFYATLFDWSYSDQSIDGGRVYTTAVVKGTQVAGIHARGDEEQRIAPQWTSYISVDNVDDAAKTAESIGGSRLIQPFDVAELSRIAIVRDTSGALVGLWQEKRSTASRLFNQHGTLNWNELATRDMTGARDFYTKLLGWSIEEKTTDEGAPYMVFRNAAGATGGMTPMTRGAQSHWRVYFDIDDTDRRVQKARAAGASVINGPRDTMFGRYALLRDPEGAMFAVISATEAVRHFPF
jgi:predicted enzyme related to lactoylglutathione lyase